VRRDLQYATAGPLPDTVSGQTGVEKYEVLAMNDQVAAKVPLEISPERLRQLTIAVARRAPLDAAPLLVREADEVVSLVLESLDVAQALRVFACLPEERRLRLKAVFDANMSNQWSRNQDFPENSVGRVMEPESPSFPVGTTVNDVVEALRPLSHQQLVYAYVVDEQGQLMGAVTMRELLFADSETLIDSIMVTEPFYFLATTPIEQAMQAVLRRHYPMYPVCDEDRKLIGVVRGYALFEQQTYELTAQAGRMVGVDKEEHLNTPWPRSLALRHPWLQLNLLTAFVAGAVVGLFEDTIAQVVALAAFLPVLAGQSGNTGCQALAVTLRAMTLKELKPGMESMLVRKEALLGLTNGAMVGVTAALAMLGYSLLNGSADPIMLAAIVLMAMFVSCTAAGVAGVLIPLALRRFGADPATASTIFLTTATDVVSMGAMLGLATLLLL
jgi:magnesium transporter